MPGLVLTTANMLATGAAEFNPFAARGETPTCLWVETDVDNASVCAGGSGGSIALSTTGGSSWTELDGPAMGSAVIRIVRSRFSINELHVLTETSYGVSYDNGGSWVVLYTAVGDELFYDLCLSHTRNVIGTSLGVRQIPSGTLLSGFDSACPNVVAVTADVVLDRFFAVCADGQCYYQAEAGDPVFVPGATLPDPAQAMVRGLWRRGEIPGILYVANGTNGVWKSINGFRDDTGWLQLRARGVGTAGAGSIWHQVGAGGALVGASAPVPSVGTYRLLAGTLDNGLIGKRIDSGAWEALPGLSETNPYGVCSPYGFPLVAYAGAFGTNRWRSLDGGVTWSAITDPGGGLAAGTTEQDVWASVPASDGTRGIWHSADQGATWSQVYVDTPGSGGSFGAWAWALAVDAAQVWWPSAPDNGQVITGGATYRQLVRTDLTGGSPADVDGFVGTFNTWEKFITHAMVDPTGAASVVLVYNAIASDEQVGTISGSTLTERHTGTTLSDPVVLGGDLHGSTIVLLLSGLGDIGELWRSTDSGATWARVAGPDANLSDTWAFEGMRVLVVDHGDPTHWYLLGADDYFWTSTDSGASWTSEHVALVSGDAWQCLTVLR